jgi:hypothetical protein
MVMLKEKTVLRVSAVVLFLAALLDLKRGFAHTFNVRYSAEYLAGIEPISDSLVLMGAFGISNFLTGSIYLLIIWKARQLVPYILLLIPLSYLLGGIGMKYQNVVMESAFVGRYIMAVYLSLCLVTGLIYLLSRIETKRSIAYEKA